MFRKILMGGELKRSLVNKNYTTFLKGGVVYG